MPAAQGVTFDVLLGGQPEVIKMFNDLEAMMKKQGATAEPDSAAILHKKFRQRLSTPDHENRPLNGRKAAV